VLIIVQNMSVPLDRRVWLECQALVAAGFGVSVICPKGPGDPSFEELDGVRLHKYAPPPSTHRVLDYFVEFAYCWARTALLALRVVLRDGVDVVQACNPPDTYWALGALFKLFGKPFVYDQHDLNPEVYSARFGIRDGALYRALVLLERMTYATADHVISTNESYRDVAERRGRKHRRDVTVVRSGPDASRMRRAEPVPALKRGREHLLVYLGIMGPQDGVDHVLRAARALRDDLGRGDFHVALLGYGDCLDELQALARTLDLDDVVTFTGRAGPEMVRDYLSTATIGLSPDPYNEFNDVSTMNKTMEYMAFELPIVAFDLKETRFSAQHAAVYVESEDDDEYARVIDELLDDPDRRREMGAFGRRRIEEALGWEHQVPQYVGVYQRVIGGDARGGARTQHLKGGSNTKQFVGGLPS
jgi:glycosyltransferase involved in cell wall biosynthesis